jgi:hypothetical protein
MPDLTIALTIGLVIGFIFGYGVRAIDASDTRDGERTFFEI